MYIYKITNLINNKIYIGQTTLTLDFRLKLHISSAYNPSAKNKTILGSAIRKYGKDNFKIELVKKCKSKQDLDNWEKLLILIAKHHQYGCYNIGSGGEGWSRGDVRKKWTYEMKLNLAFKRKSKCDVYFKNCLTCGNIFTTKYKNTNYCSQKCKSNSTIYKNNISKSIALVRLKQRRKND